MSSNAKIFQHRLDTASKSGPIYGCIHIPDSPVQAFIRNEPDLRRKPIAVLDGAFPLFTVVATNAFARKLGIRIGMTQLQIERFTNLAVRYRSREQEDSAHRALVDCAHFFTPRVEETSNATVTLDLNGLSRLWGSPREIAQKLFRATDGLGLETHVAIAPNPDAAIHAAKGDSGITVISPGDEAQKLDSLDLCVLSPPEEIQAAFNRWGLQSFQDLTRLPTVSVAERLGQEGVELQRMARGATSRPLRVLNGKPYFKEIMELEESIDSLEPLAFIFTRLLKQLCQRLEARNLATNELHLTLKLEPPFDEKQESTSSFIRTIRVPIPTRDHRLLAKLLQLDLDAHHPPAPVAEIALTAKPVQPRRIQTGLFHPSIPEPEKLELTLARIGAIVGTKNIGSPEVLDTHHPNRFHIRHFMPTHVTTRRKPSSERPASMALRIFRPPLEARVELLGGEPSRIFFSGKSGKIVTARGPWHNSGEWWQERRWKREEWDIEVQNVHKRVLYRIYRDAHTNQWFVDATYD